MVRDWRLDGQTNPATTRSSNHNAPRLLGELVIATSNETGVKALELSQQLRDAGWTLAAAMGLDSAVRFLRRDGLVARAGQARNIARELHSDGVRLLFVQNRGFEGQVALTARERDVGRMALTGATNREIADELGLSKRTVETHLQHIYAKLGSADREMLRAAIGSVSEAP
jgi:DNA-binding CsgD family transcriptional regulator